MLRVFEADWHAQTMEPGIIPDDEPVDALVLKGKELLSAYYHRPAAPIREAEVSVQIPLIHRGTGEVLDRPLRGYIDLIEADGTLVEFKTTQKRWAVSDLPDNLQLTTYAYAFELLYGMPAKALKLVTLIRTKTPVIETLTTARGPEDYDRLFHLSKAVLRGIRAGVFFPNRGCWLCRDCEYDADCREWAGNEECAPAPVSLTPATP